MAKENVFYEEGISIQGEKIVFTCREHKVNKQPSQGSSAHRAQQGWLKNAKCTIDKRFRQIPEKE